VLADAVNNASGLGFNGYDEKGNARWDLITNVHIIAIEVSVLSRRWTMDFFLIATPFFYLLTHLDGHQYQIYIRQLEHPDPDMVAPYRFRSFAQRKNSRRVRFERLLAWILSGILFDICP